MSDSSIPRDFTNQGDLDSLLSRLQVIEGQPLTQRAPAFAQLHDELRSALEGADTSA